MRGRRRRSSSSVSQQHTSMALRKQALRDASDIPSGSQQVDTDTQDDGVTDDGEDNDEHSSSILLLSTARDKRRRERENKSKPKEMTEEEMMDLALHLSKQEANITALRLQKEEEAMMKAIQESMNTQTESQSLLADGGASHRLCSRRKLSYSNGQTASAIGQGASEDDCTPEIDLNRGVKRGGDENKTRNKKRKRKDGSPLLEMPDLSQTQKIYSQASPSSFAEPMDSPQSCDSTQIDDCELRKSPVFPATGRKTEVHIPRLSQDLLQTCRTSGFVLCSQESWMSPQQSLPTQTRSPTFPQSPQRSTDLTLSKSPVLSETEQEDDGETQLSPEYFKSPVFGRNTQHEKSTSACKPQITREISGFTLSSQETLTPSVRSTSCRPKSPVFPRSPGLPSNSPPTEKSETFKSPVSSETDGEPTGQSPVFGRTQPQQKIHQEELKRSASPSAAESRPSGRDGSPPAAAGELHRLRQERRTDLNPDIDVNVRSESGPRDLIEPSKGQNSAEVELSSDMILLWSDDDEDVTPVGSPSPVFPEEKSLHQADVKHRSAASPGTSGSNCRLSSASTSRQQLSTTEQEQLPDRVQETVGKAPAPLGEGAAGPMVHYYWGIPFCPRGLDPDNYTQVILAQMEVYEKSLKQAQRCLLRKAEWGEAILPQPENSQSSESPLQHGPRRRGVRLRGEAADSPAAERGNDEDNNDECEDREEEKKSEEEEEVHVDTDDCEVCPETQLSVDDDDRTQDLMMDTDAGAETKPKSPELPEVEMISRDSPARGEMQEEDGGKEEREEDMEVEVELDALVDRKTRGNVPLSGSGDVGGPNVRQEEEEEDQGDPDVEEIKGRVLQRSSSPELDPAAVPQRPESSVDCPICQGSFPVTEIEMHAAYCDGEVAVVDERRSKDDRFQVSLKPRRRRTRRSEATDDEANDPPNTSRNLERCYICQKFIQLRDYRRHTEFCIRSKTSARGNLLSALEQTESRDSETAGPSGSKLQSGDVIDLLDDDEEDEEDGGVSSVGISNSPIRSFTPISEASGCLIDFKKQQRAKRLNQRRR